MLSPPSYSHLSSILWCARTSVLTVESDGTSQYHMISQHLNHIIHRYDFIHLRCDLASLMFSRSESAAIGKRCSDATGGHWYDHHHHVIMIISKNLRHKRVRFSYVRHRLHLDGHVNPLGGRSAPPHHARTSRKVVVHKSTPAF